MTIRSPWASKPPSGRKCTIWCCRHISRKKLLHQLTTVSSGSICVSDLITFCGTSMAHKYMNRINCWRERWLFEKNKPSQIDLDELHWGHLHLYPLIPAARALNTHLSVFYSVRINSRFQSGFRINDQINERQPLAGSAFSRW